MNITNTRDQFRSLDQAGARREHLRTDSSDAKSSHARNNGAPADCVTDDGQLTKRALSPAEYAQKRKHEAVLQQAIAECETEKAAVPCKVMKNYFQGRIDSYQNDLLAMHRPPVQSTEAAWQTRLTEKYGLDPAAYNFASKLPRYSISSESDASLAESDRGRGKSPVARELARLFCCIGSSAPRTRD